MLDALKAVTQETSQALQNLHQMQAEWLQQATPAAGEQPGANSMLAAAQHAMKVSQTLNNSMMRQAHFWQSHLPSMLSAAQNPATFNALIAFQSALMQRLADQHKEWVDGLHDVMHGTGQMRSANTVSKLMEQEYNFSAQLGSLMMNQLTSVAELLENAQVDLGYLLSQSNSEQP